MSNNMIARISALPAMTAPDLKKLWKNLYTTEPPPFNKVYFVKRLAYRMQELTYNADSHALERNESQNISAQIAQDILKIVTKTPQREYIPGETHLYMGRQYRLKVIQAVKKDVKRSGNFLIVHSHYPRNPHLSMKLPAFWPWASSGSD